jgi:hypothetical protein
MKKITFTFFLLLSFVSSGWAATYSFPTALVGAPFNCTNGGGGNYSNCQFSLANNDVVNITSPVTITVRNNINIVIGNYVSINVGGQPSSFILNTQNSKDITIGNNCNIVGNIYSAGSLDVGDANTLSGTLESGGNGANASIIIGNSNTITGSIICPSCSTSDVVLGANNIVDGSCSLCPPTFSSISASATGTMTAILGATPSKTGTIYYLVNTSAIATPTQVKAGSSVAVTTANQPQSINVTALLSASTTYYAHLLIRSSTGVDSAVYTTSSFITPPTPTLSSVSATVTGGATATLSGMPNVDGTMYYVVTTSPTAPSVVQVKAGQTNTGVGASFAGNGSASAATLKSFGVTGLTTATAYYAYLVLKDSQSFSSDSVVYSTGGFIPMAGAVFDAWDSAQGATRPSTPKIYTKLAGQSGGTSVYIGNGYSFTGAVCAEVMGQGGTVLGGGSMQCKDYAGALSLPFTWTISQADRAAKINMMAQSGVSTGGVVPTSWAGWSAGISSDSFAIRPKSFTFGALSSPVSAGENLSATFVAKDALDANLSSYNGSVSLITELDKSGKTNCYDTLNDTSVASPLLFSNGLYSFSGNFTNIGSYTLRLKDSSWTLTDWPNDCVAVGCDIESTMTIVSNPTDFVITGLGFGQKGRDYTYYLKDNGAYLKDMNVTIGGAITAVGIDNNKTGNYSSGCYANNDTLWFTMPAVTSATAQKSEYAVAADLKFVAGAATLSSSSAPTLAFNYSIARDASVNPRLVTKSDVNLTIKDQEYNLTKTSASSDWGASDSVLFIDGRLNAISTDVFCVSGTTCVCPGAKVFVEFYSSDGNLSAFGLGGVYRESINARGWYVNSLNNASEASFLDAVPVSQKPVFTTVSSIAYNGEITLPPVSVTTETAATMYLRTSPWLWRGANPYAETTSCSSQPCLPLGFFFGSSSSTPCLDWVGPNKNTVAPTPSGRRDKKRTTW